MYSALPIRKCALHLPQVKKVLLQLFLVDDLPARIALCPEPVGDLFLLGFGSDVFFGASEPGHGWCLVLMRRTQKDFFDIQRFERAGISDLAPGKHRCPGLRNGGAEQRADRIVSEDHGPRACRRGSQRRSSAVHRLSGQPCRAGIERTTSATVRASTSPPGDQSRRRGTRRSGSTLRRAVHRELR